MAGCRVSYTRARNRAIGGLEGRKSGQYLSGYPRLARLCLGLVGLNCGFQAAAA
jgi:hypothetical protein